jgi:hypothetical protein
MRRNDDDEFVLPEPDDFCKKWLSSADGKRCTLGHVRALLSPRGISDRRFFRAWNRSADVAGIIRLTSRLPIHPVFARNDHRSTTTAQLARAFRLTVEALGFEITA